jgi:hypothetical protein
LVNVPILSSLVIEHQLRSTFSAHGVIESMAPHMYKNTPLQSNRWDLVLRLTENKPLSTAPFFDLLGFKVMASWPGSDKACPRCKEVGHDSHTCPRRPKPKASRKRTPATKQPTSIAAPIQPASSTSVAADTAPSGVQSLTQATTSDATPDVAPTSDPIDEEMGDASSSSTPLPSSTYTITSRLLRAMRPERIQALPTSTILNRMDPEDFVALSPAHLRALPPHLTPSSISKELHDRLSPAQKEALPKSIRVKAATPAPSLMRTRSQDKK